MVLDFRVDHRPECPKGAKDEVKQARRAQSQPEGSPPKSWGPNHPVQNLGKKLSDKLTQLFAVTVLFARLKKSKANIYLIAFISSN